jgi:dTDP-4-amino-4,6-dideoxygalactose transaminase
MIPITKPTLPPYEDVEPVIRAIYTSGQITNGRYVRAFEEKAAEFLGVKHVVAAPSCSTGLVVLLSTLPACSEVVMPAFTFSATYQALLWNGFTAQLVDCNDSCNMDVSKVEQAITPRTTAILAVHMYGTATDVEELEEIARRRNLPLFFDAAHGFGAKYKGRHLGGFGAAEVFSLGPTKTLPVGEGGLISTNDENLAQRVRLACNHGQPPNSLDSTVRSLNGRLEEINAAIGIRVLDDVDHWIEHRQELAAMYYAQLAHIPGLSFPVVPQYAVSSFKDFCIFVDPDRFGMDRDELLSRLEEDHIQAKRYFYPPIHELTVARGHFRGVRLPNTEFKASRVLALPMYSHIAPEEVSYVCQSVSKAHMTSGLRC